jgi:lysozyme
MNRKQLFRQLRIDEGVRYEIYQDHLGYLTFGVGHLITDSDPESGKSIGTRVSEERVIDALKQDVDNAIWDCDVVFGVSKFRELPGPVQEVVVNMMFNLGRPRFSQFVKFIAALNERNWNKAAKEGRDSLWYHQVKNRAERLMSRLENIS